MIGKTDVLGNFAYASAVMSCAPEIPGYNGSMFAIGEETKDRIEADLVAARASVEELMGAALEVEQSCRQHDGAEVESFRRLAAAIIACESSK